MVKYARGKNIEAIFFTNGLLLDNKIAEEVVELGVSQIFCSLPAGTAKTYSLVTHREDPKAFNRVLDNLKYLALAKSRKNKINPRLIMTHVIHALNYKEILEMAGNDARIGADVIRFYLIRLDDNIKFLQLKPGDVEVIRESMSKVKDLLKDTRIELLDTTDFQLSHYEKDSGAWSKGVFLREGCLLGWFFCLVPALGDISLCCHLRTVGYLKERSFQDIWTSKEYAKYRVQAKYLKDNKDVTFLNGVKLYDEHCEHCDTHQVIRDIQEDLKNYNLDRFVFSERAE
jgi:MoaA/NifB/PqqE/SkfB family radical SAM enzyme